MEILNNSLLLSSFIIRIGDRDHNSKEDDHRLKFYNISQFVTHPKFKKDEAYYDVAVLKTEIKVEFSDFISPICLPSSTENIWSAEELNFKQLAVVIGWGSKHPNGKISPALRQAELTIFEQW